MEVRPRLLVIIGSGEMAPRMTRVQRAVVQRLAGASKSARPVSAAIIDTPYGFQENAEQLSAQATDYFSRRLGLSVALASFRGSDDVVARETALARIGRADYVFSGPGSPSYALRHWLGSGVANLLADKLAGGGAVVFASAAAITLGRFALPVYEIYKAGADPHWLPGLDVLGRVGISAAVVPHFDNAEGSGFDTRFCLIGERRMRLLEEELPADVLVLGVDEHTAIVLDLGAGTARVEGRGGVTVRRRDGSHVYRAGTELPLDELSTRPTDAVTPQDGVDQIARSRRRLDADDPSTMIGEVLRAGDPALMRAAMVRLGESLQRAEGDRERLLEPLIEMLLELRRQAREEGDYTLADDIRDRLGRLGVSLADEPDGSTRFEVG